MIAKSGIFVTEASAPLILPDYQPDRAANVKTENSVASSPCAGHNLIRKFNLF